MLYVARGIYTNNGKALYWTLYYWFYINEFYQILELTVEIYKGSKEILFMNEKIMMQRYAYFNF